MHKMIILVLALSGCTGYIPFSGDRLDGVLSESPSDWSAIAATKIIRLETQTSDPYSVNLWVIGLGENLYVHSGDTLTTWVEHMQTDPRVRLGHAGKIYELTASRVIDTQEFADFVGAYEAKYGNPPRNANLSEIYLFRLVAR